ncbi:MAG: FeoB-associated Cys-rich membrane protein [Ruminococcus sp.]|nr:FeoB-associated Cys-rich membrane protein [Ruminococcus sp.]MBR6792591.1 FeoB-associated Cys-rich membrane protein [Ruminococcus sp.]
MENVIIIAVVIIIVGLASLYIYKAKKSGQKCIGCPYSKSCSSGKCNCGNNKNQ